MREEFDFDIDQILNLLAGFLPDQPPDRCGK